MFTDILESGAMKSLVVMNSHPLVAQRRLELMQGSGIGSSTAGSHDINRRCSLVEGVCYHTFEEMLHLHGVDVQGEGGGGVYGGRRLLFTYFSFGQISAAIGSGSTSSLTSMFM